MKIAVVVLNFKVKKSALKCIDSVKKSVTDELEIILVDNASNDGIKDKIGSGIKFIQNQNNRGYSGGNNVGIKKALEDGVEYVLILNPDTIIDKDCIKNLLEGMERNQVQIVGPKIYFSNSKKIWYVGGIMDLENVIGKHRGVDEEDRGQYDKEMKTDFVSGAAIMIKKEVFKKIGFFDERYFLYYEDSDFCYRAGQEGFKIMYLPKAVVYHENAKSTGLGSPLQDYYITRNRMLFASKFLPLRTRFALFKEALRNLGNPVRRLAFWDFITGNFGKGSLN